MSTEQKTAPQLPPAGKELGVTGAHPQGQGQEQKAVGSVAAGLKSKTELTLLSRKTTGTPNNDSTEKKAKDPEKTLIKDNKNDPKDNVATKSLTSVSHLVSADKANSSVGKETEKKTGNDRVSELKGEGGKKAVVQSSPDNKNPAKSVNNSEKKVVSPRDNLNSSQNSASKKFSNANKAAKIIPALMKKGSDKKDKPNDVKKWGTVKKQPSNSDQNGNKGDANSSKGVKASEKDNNSKNQKDSKPLKSDTKRNQGDENMSNKTDISGENKQTAGMNNNADKTKAGDGMHHVGKSKWAAIIAPHGDPESRGNMGNPLAVKNIHHSNKNLRESCTTLTIPKEIRGEEATHGSRLSVQSGHSRRESFSRLSIDSRFVDFSKTQNASVIHPPGMDEEKKKGIVSNNDSFIKAAIPYLPMWLAIICLILNVILPGIGTVISGFALLCSGRPRIESKDDTIMTSCSVNVMVGLCQLFTVTFLLVGWFWSISWGIYMVILAGEYKREREKEHEFHLQALVIGAFGGATPQSPRLQFQV